MAHETIGTAVMVMTTVIITAALLNALFPSILGSAVSLKATGAEADDRAATSLAFVNTEVVSPSQLRFDVLNTGRPTVYGPQIQISTVYLALENQPMELLAYNTSATETYWTYTLTGNDINWDQGETMVLLVTNPTGSFPAGDYKIRLQPANGALSGETFRV